MRKPVALLLAATLAGGAFALPASAGGKKKKIHESFTAELLPFPANSTIREPLGMERPGCLSGQEGIHWMRVPFDPPAAGTLTAYTEGFTGDWDLYITNEEGTPLVSSEQAQVDAAMAPPEERVEIKLKPHQVVNIETCNWAGEPENEIHYEFVFTGTGKKKGSSKHKHH